jgi:hypothetical protein
MLGLAAGLASAVVLVGCTSGATTHPSDAAAGSYGSLPTWLPTTTIEPDSVLTGSAARPALTTEGDGVEVSLPGDSSVRATVSGPVVPGEGLPFQAPATTCTWTVTLSQASASIPIAASDFTALDHLGSVYHVAVVGSQAGAPTVLTPGQSVTLALRAVMPTGEGLLRWAPDGHDVVASWDFEVEND